MSTSSCRSSPTRPTRASAQLDAPHARSAPPVLVRKLNEALEVVAAGSDQARTSASAPEKAGLDEVQRRGREIRELLRQNPHAVASQAVEAAGKPQRVRPGGGNSTPSTATTGSATAPKAPVKLQVTTGSVSERESSARSAEASTATPAGSARSLGSVPTTSPEASARSKSLASATPPASARLLSQSTALLREIFSGRARSRKSTQEAPPPSSSRSQASNPPVAAQSKSVVDNSDAAFKHVIDNADAGGCQISAPRNTPRTIVRLGEAARCGDVEAMRECLADGESVGARDLDGWMPLHYAAAEGHLEACRLLLEARSDANGVLPDFSTPLMLAAEEAHISVAQLLLEGGARLQCRDEAGFTASERCAPAALDEFNRCVQMSM